MKIPREIDDLMWEVAEADSVDLIDDFGARYPAYKAELVGRLKMVRELKGARPKAEAQQPVFHPTPEAPVRKAPRAMWLFALAGGFLLVSGVLAGMMISGWLPRSQQAALNTAVTNQAPAFERFPEPTENSAQLEQRTWIPGPPPQGSPQPSTQPPPAYSPFDRKVTVQVERGRLSDVLQQVATLAGVRLQAAPGMPDPEIVADYAEMPAISVLNDLGRNFGFTTLKQTETEALLVPAIDPRNPPPGAQGGFAEAIGGSGSGGGQTGGDGIPSSEARSSGNSVLPAPGMRGPIGP